MNYLRTFSLRRPAPGFSRQGMALILVLAMLVLVTILVVSFFRRASVERVSAGAYFENYRNSLLMDQAVRIVQNQIDHASTRPSTAWASQPGMVRTFQSNGSLQQAYKLYSDREMVTDSVSLDAAHGALASWAGNPAVFADLNAPVNGVYPILDPGARDHVAGFSVEDGENPATAESPLPMPVRWLYVLEDGTIVAAEPAGDGAAAVSGATEANPIVGRMAFWTDDETSKLNINTASHGTFWDIPRVFSQEERDRMARFQPAAREFQRYPGHPASTSLAPVFGHLFGGPDNLDETALAEFVFRLAPRLETGGSNMGTAIPSSPVQLDDHRLFSSLDELLFDPDRQMDSKLSPEELERVRFFLTARSNAPEVNLFNLPRMAIWPVNGGAKTPSEIDKLVAFCATVGGHRYYLQRQDPNSATNDLNAFGGRNLQLYNYINFLMDAPPPGFGSTSFAQKYPGDESRQIVTQIFDYIRASNLYSTAFGATPYTSGLDLDRAPKLEDPNETFPPATAGSGAGQVVPLRVGNTKGFGRLPVISRAVFQLFVSGARMPVVDSVGNPIIENGQPRENEYLPPRRGRTGTGAINRTPELSENLTSAETLYGSWKRFRNGEAPYTSNDESHEKAARLLTSGIIYFDTFDPMYGYSTPRYNFDIRVRFSGPWSVSGQALNFPDSTLHIRRDHARAYDARTDVLQGIWQGRQLGGPLLPQWLMQNYSWVRGNAPDPLDQAKNGGLPYPLVSDRVALHPPISLVNRGDAATPDWDFPLYTSIEGAMGNVDFSGGDMTVELLVNGEVVQTYEFKFDAFTKPLPGYDGAETAPLATSRPMFKQMPVSFDFRHRWQASPHLHRINSSDTTYLYPDSRLVQARDVAVSLVPRLGDKRLLAARPSLGADDFLPHEHYSDTSRRTAVDFREDAINMSRGKVLSTHPSSRLLNVNYGWNALPDIPTHLQGGVQQALGLNFPPDFDNGTYQMPDDAYVNRADEGSAKDAITSTDFRATAWYSDSLFKVDEAEFRSVRDNATFYSPNRQMPSAVMFGSLPTGVIRNRPWQTLHFRPDPGGHPGAANPPDYTLLDLFWMPVVEPYAISEPFSTNGKVNMNFQIMPFGGYITRATAVQGVLETEKMLVVQNSHADSNGSDLYKGASSGGSDSSWSSVNFRKKIDIGETLKGFEAVFDQDRIFRSETEICALPLIPEGATYSADFETAYWDSRRLTGDNSRERPYAHILPRLTTRSNTYTVHFLVQSLKKAPNTPPGVWQENRDAVTAESRGSRTIERYIEPNPAPDNPIPNYAAATDPLDEKTLDQFYRWRVIANREFLP